MLSLALALLVLAATPGPGVFATVSRAMASGFLPALPVVAGIITGDLVFLLLAVLGLSFLAHLTSRPAAKGMNRAAGAVMVTTGLVIATRS